MTNRYKIDPNFVAREPTPAKHFWMLPDPGTPEARQKLVDGALAEWRRKDEIKQIRVTLTGPDIEDDKSNYPPGIWLEGWTDEDARQLPFGSPWPNKDSAIWPPLTSDAQPQPEDSK